MTNQAALKVVAVNHRTPEQFAKLINEKWQEQVSSIIEVGLLLQTAKEELKHGELKTMKGSLPFGEATVRKLVAIADNESLSNRSIWNDLPASWTILYELSLLTAEQFDAALAAGSIHPKMRIKDAKALRGIVPKQRKPKKPSAAEIIDPQTRCCMHIRQITMAVLDELSLEERARFIAEIRDEIDDIEKQTGGMGDG